MINSLYLNVPMRPEKISYPPFLRDGFYYREDIDESLGNKDMQRVDNETILSRVVGFEMYAW